ncbi:MAG: FIG00821051: hypothetical protein, partial [uncultured Nocardioidaceae bacterium]
GITDGGAAPRAPVALEHQPVGEHGHPGGAPAPARDRRGRLLPDRAGAGPATGLAARHAAHGDAAAARRCPGHRGRAVRRHRRAHRGLARSAPHRRHRAGTQPQRRGPHRPPGRHPRHVQPSLRAAGLV